MERRGDDNGSYSYSPVNSQGTGDRIAGNLGSKLPSYYRLPGTAGAGLPHRRAQGHPVEVSQGATFLTWPSLITMGPQGDKRRHTMNVDLEACEGDQDTLKDFRLPSFDPPEAVARLTRSVDRIDEHNSEGEEGAVEEEGDPLLKPSTLLAEGNIKALKRQKR